MRTDVKVGLICAFAIVLCVVIYFVAKGKPSAPLAVSTSGSGSHVTPNSDLRPATPATPANPVVSDPLMPDHTLASGSPVSGVLIAPPGGSTPSPSYPAAPTTPVGPSGSSALGTSGAPTTPTTPGMYGSTPTLGTPTTPTTPTIGSSTIGTPTGSTPTFGSTPTTPTPITPIIPTTATPTLVIGVTPTPSLTGATTYKIQKGDMLGAIAKKFNVSLKAIESANPGIDSNRLKVGADIKIPAASATPAVAVRTPGTVTPTSPTTPRTAVAPTHPVSTPVVVTIKPGSTYTIKKGDTLATIAKAAYGTTTSAGGQKIFRANRDALNDPDVMPIGAAIKIP